MYIITNSVDETIELGEKLGKLLSDGDCICLDGELGAGKTHFSKGIAKGLGINDDISSPTFTIVQEYEGSPALFHFDMYRLSDSSELYYIGYDDYLSKNQVMLIEWAKNVIDVLPDDRLEVNIYYTELENQRKFEFTPFGEGAKIILDRLNE